jgi:tetratricopeptide (TPR) repeat protein
MRKCLAVILTTLLAASAAAQNAAAPSQTPDEAEALNARVVKLAGEGKYEEALPLARRVVELRSKAAGDKHVSVAGAHMNLAVVLQELKSFEEAEETYKRALSIYEKAGDEYAPQAARALDALARLTGDLSNAVSLHERALKLEEKSGGPQSARLAPTLFRLGHLYELRDDYGRAEESFKRFVEISEQAKAAPDDTGVALLRLGCLSKKKGKTEEAEEFRRRAGEILRNSTPGLAYKIIEGGYLDGKTLSKPPPSYPVEARKGRVQGKVLVSVIVGESGDVLAACASEGPRQLEAPSERAAYSARFAPSLLMGKPARLRGVMTYNYVIR